MFNDGNNIEKKIDNNFFRKSLVLLLFIVGLLNSKPYLEFMGLSIISDLLLLTFYAFLSLLFMIMIFNYLVLKKGRFSTELPFWGVILIAIVLKFLVLFIQFPSSFLPGEPYFFDVLLYSGNILLLILIANGINSFDQVKSSILAFGFGLSFSAIIPFLFFPGMIGSRKSLIYGYDFNGAFWNSSVIAFISVGWLLVALSFQVESKFKKVISIAIFVLLGLGGLAGLSRATLFAIAMSILVYLIASKKILNYIKVILAFTLVFFIVANLFQDAFQEVADNFEERLEGGIDIESEGRYIIWRDYLEIEDIADYILLGELQGNYTKYSIKGYAPHSVFLNWITQFGILGLIGFFMILIGIIISIKYIRLNGSNQVAAALYAWLSAYLFVATLNETGFKQLTIFAAFGIILAWGQQAKAMLPKS